MKIYKALIYTALLALISCNNDFMDRYPKDSLSDPSFWSTVSDLETYANGLYTNLPSASGRDLDNNSDNKVPSSPNSYLYSEYTVPASGGGWSSGDWSDIRACNYFLNRYHTVTGNAEDIAVYVGEIKFFRAWEYFSKIKRFGDIPWISDDLGTSDSEILYGDRTARAVVVDSIIADLNFAIANLPELANAKNNRVHADAARAFKARVCLHEGTYAKYHGGENSTQLLTEAKNSANEIITSERYSLYTTGDSDMDYYNMFIMEDLSKCTESIFYRSYVQDIQMHNNTRQMGESGTGFSKDMVESYLCVDGLPISSSTLYQGDNRLEDEIANRDPRLKQTIDNKDLPFSYNQSGEPIYNNLPVIKPGYCTTGYYVMKSHSADPAQVNANQSTLDWNIFRYGETLLIYAEATAELGAVTQADLDKSINLLRSRVGVAPMSSSINFTDSNWPNYGYSLSPILHEIRRERRVELAAEGFRWDDIVRWKSGKLIENPKTVTGIKIAEELVDDYGSELDGIELTSDRYINVYPGRSQRVWDDKLYLYPLPTEELELNPQLKPQNPGWSN